MNDPDAIWKPGYDGPAPVVPPVTGRSAPASGSGGERSTDSDTGEGLPTVGTTRPSRRRVLAVVAAASLIAGFIALDPIDLRSQSVPDGAVDSEAISSDDAARRTIAPPDRSVFGGPAARRLPESATELWSNEIQTGRDHWVEAIRRDVVLVAVTPTGGSTTGRTTGVPSALVREDEATTSLVAFDASSGERRWTSTFTGEPDDLDVVGAVDEVVVLEQRGPAGVRLVALDVRTGAPVWSGEETASAGHVGLVGTPLIARLPSPTNRFVGLIEATTGREAGRIISEPTGAGQPGGWTTDGSGTWYVVDGGLVVGYDLGSELGERAVIGPVGDATSPRIVVDQRLATVDDGGSLVLIDESGRARGSRALATDVAAPVISLTPVVGANFVVTSPGSIAGASLEGERIGINWSLDEGALVDHHPVADGTVLQVATRGGGANKLVDGLRGDTIVHLTMTPGALQSLVVAGDGIVTLRTSSGLGQRLAALDLDGRERWWLPGTTPVVVGDDIVVRATPTGPPAETDETDGSDGSAESDGSGVAEPVTTLQVVAYGDPG